MQALSICVFNLSKRKDGKGDRSFEVLAQNLQKVGFEVVKCDKHSSLVFSIRDVHLHKVKGQLSLRSMAILVGRAK